MIRPRWRKVFHDLWENKVRSLMVIASIAIGLFAIGMIGTAYMYMSHDMQASYESSNPANILINTDSFDRDLIKSVRKLPGVGDATGARTVVVRLRTGPDKWISLNLIAIDFNQMQVNRIQSLQGKWPPADQQVLIDKNKYADTNASIGDLLEIELPSGKLKKIQLVGIVHDLSIGSTNGNFFTANAQGYINIDTLKWLEQPENFNQLYVTVSDHKKDVAHVKAIAEKVKDQVKRSNRQIYSTNYRITEHPANSYLQAMIGVMGILGLLIVFLSGFLISNTLTSLLNQQMRQIGIMKSIGARSKQIIWMYLVFILVFSLMALVIAVPLGSQAAYWLVDTISRRLNFNVQGFRLIPEIVVIQAIIALAVPLLAAAFPVIEGARVTVQRAMTGVNLSSNNRRSWLDNLVENVRGLSRPMLISLRNTFRRKGRLVLTLITLTLGGAIFIATFNVQASLDSYIQIIRNYFRADVNLTFNRSYLVDDVRQHAMAIPGVSGVENWATPRAELVIDGKTTNDTVQVFAPPSNTSLVKPLLLQGRWLLPQDQNAITINEVFLNKYPDTRVGDVIKLKIDGRELDWIIVGIFQFTGGSQLIAYVNHDFLSKELGDVNQSYTFRIIANNIPETLEAQKQLAQLIEAKFNAAGFRINDISAGLSLMRSAASGLNILIGVLLVLAILTALVGSIGLMGTMSMNVMERTREIGIMRSIGASDRAIMTLVIVEGLIIGAISWFVGSILAFPISYILANIVSQAIFQVPASFTITPLGFSIWLLAVLGLSILASVLPARNAARLTIREVLAYE